MLAVPRAHWRLFSHSKGGELGIGCFGAGATPLPLDLAWVEGKLALQVHPSQDGDERWAAGVLASRPQLLPACWERGHQVIPRFGQPLSLS